MLTARILETTFYNAFVAEPDAHRPNWSAISGVLLCISWAPMAIAIPRLPDLDSMAEVNRFWEDNFLLMQAVIASVSIGFMFLLVFLGGVAEWLRRAGGALAFTAFGSAVTFMTALNVALGLDIGAGLLQQEGSGQSSYTLHSAAFLLAAPAAPAGAAFFMAIAFASFGKGAFPRVLGWLAVLGAIANIGALGGVVSLDGPLNSGNGVVGGIAAPLGLFLAWILGVSVWWLMQEGGSEAPVHEGLEDLARRG
jgi:hypothetical protein